MLLFWKILGLFILNWFIHYRLFVWMEVRESECDSDDIDDADRNAMALVSLIPLLSTLAVLWIALGSFFTNRDKEGETGLNVFLKFVGGMGTNQIRFVKEKIKKRKEKTKIVREKKQEEKDKYSRADIMDLED
jgi:hypothetical protein